MQLAEDRLCSSCKAHGLEIKKAHGPCSYLYSISSRCLSSSLSASLHNCNVCSRVMLRHPNSSHQCLTGAAATVRLTSYHSLHGRPRHLVRDRPLAKVAGPEGSPKVVTFVNHKGSFLSPLIGENRGDNLSRSAKLRRTRQGSASVGDIQNLRDAAGDAEVARHHETCDPVRSI